MRLEPQYHERVWGGHRLRRVRRPTGEVWVVHEANRITGGTFNGLTLGNVVRQHGAALLGESVQARFGPAFPLLIKLIDTADWLSIQVHPDDRQARALEGPEATGKTEAWHVLEARPEGRLIAGLQTPLEAEEIKAAIHNGTIINHVRYQPVRDGDNLFIPPGTLHALGPGLLIYEVQQPSDITYRIFDWNRPVSADRPLHITQSLAVLDPTIEVTPEPLATSESGGRKTAITCPYFTLETLSMNGSAIHANTGGKTFHALTVAAGSVAVSGDGWREDLERYESLLLPASIGAYAMTSSGSSRILRARVP